MTTARPALAAVALTTLAVLAPGRAQAALVNGGFESPDVATWALKAVGDTSISGWTVVGNTISFQDNSAFGQAGAVASEGRQFLELSGVVGRGGGVRSDPFATTAGASYRLAFDIGAFFIAGQGSYGNVTVDLWIDGQAAGSFTNLLGLSSAGSDWETGTIDFVAAGTWSTVEFRSSLLTSSSDLGVGLDNIRLAELAGPPPAVPEPGSLAMAALGLAAIGLRARVGLRDNRRHHAAPPPGTARPRP